MDLILAFLFFPYSTDLPFEHAPRNYQSYPANKELLTAMLVGAALGVARFHMIIQFLAVGKSKPFWVLFAACLSGNVMSPPNHSHLEICYRKIIFLRVGIYLLRTVLLYIDGRNNEALITPY